VKPGKGLRRRVGLKTNTPLRAKKPLEQKGTVPGSSSVQPKRSSMKPYRPPAKTLEEKEARAAVAKRSGGRCEAAIHGVCQGQAREFQHRQAKGQMGGWTSSNGLAVCGHGNALGCHGYIHQHPLEAYEKGWSVRSWDDPLEREVLYRGRWVLLDDNGGMTAVEKGEAA
jgi:hypothetical protein